MATILNNNFRSEVDKENLEIDNNKLHKIHEEIDEGIKRQFQRKIDEAFEIIFNNEALLELDTPMLLNEIKNIIKEKC